MSAKNIVEEARTQMKDKTFEAESFVQKCINEGYTIKTSSEVADKFGLVEADLGDAIIDSDDFAKVIYHQSEDSKWFCNDEDIKEAETLAKDEACKYAATLDPVLIIDKSGDIGILPIYKDNDKYLSEYEVADKIMSLVPTETEITLFGNYRDFNYYEPPEYDEKEITVEIETLDNFIDDMTSAVAEDVAEYKKHDISKLLDSKARTDIEIADI